MNAAIPDGAVTIRGKWYLTIAGYAEKHGVTRQRVWQWAVRDNRFRGVLRKPTILIPLGAERPRDKRETKVGA